MTLDLHTHTISPSANFSGDENSNHVVNVKADRVKISNGTIAASGDAAKHALNVYCAKGVVLEGLTIDGTGSSKGGVPLVVNSSEVTVRGSLDVKTGTGGSWGYGINVDGSTGNPAAVLTFDDNAQVTFNENTPCGIYVENSNKEGTTVSFGENVALSSERDGFVPIRWDSSDEGIKVDGLEDTNIGIVNGVTHVHHYMSLNDAVEPACTMDGHEATQVCTVDDCGARIEGAVKPALGYTPEHHAYKAPTATESGNIEYWECQVCHKLFYDAAMKNEITAADAVVIAPSEEPVELYTVTFKFGTGEDDLVIQVPEGQAVYAPKDPTFDGYTFLAWYADEALTEKYDFSQPVTGDLTLYAGWLRDGVDGGSDADVVKPGDDKPATDAEKTDGLAQTSDAVSFLPAIVAGAAGITAAAGALTLRRRSK